MKELLHALLSGVALSKTEARSVMEFLLSDEGGVEQKIALLTLYAKKLPSPVELREFRTVLLEKARRVHVSKVCIDVCGTGGDGKNTFNISTATAFLLAAAGVPVAKHGNYGASSMCGSSNVLEFLKVPFLCQESEIQASIEKHNFVYLHAPLFHPALKGLGPIRKSLGFRTIFNFLGPLANPVRGCLSFCGVSAFEYMALYADVLAYDDNPFAVLHSYDGYDEISLTSKWKVLGRESGHRYEKVYSPHDLGLHSWEEKDLRAGDTVEEAAELFLKLLKGKGTQPQQEVLLANATFAYRVLKPEVSPIDALHTLREVLKEGLPYALLESIKDTK